MVSGHHESPGDGVPRHDGTIAWQELSITHGPSGGYSLSDGPLFDLATYQPSGMQSSIQEFTEMLMKLRWTRAHGALFAGAALLGIAADEPKKPPVSPPQTRPVKPHRSPRRSRSRGPTIPNGSTCSPRSFRTNP